MGEGAGGSAASCSDAVKIRGPRRGGQEGETVMEHLRQLDHVAYVRFASVYRSFEDLNEFRQEIDKLSAEQSE